MAKRPEKLKVLIVKPNKEPVVKEVNNDLYTLQQLVGGYIETIRLDSNTLLVRNADGKSKKLLPNRPLQDADGIVAEVICGTFLLLRESSDDFASLNTAQLKKYTEKYALRGE